MAIEAGIYNQLNIPDPMGLANTVGLYQQGKILQVDRQNKLAQLAQQQAIGQQQLQGGAIDLQQKQQAQNDENTMRQMYKDSGGDVSSMVNQLRAQGMHTQADSLVKTLRDQAIGNMDMAAKRNDAAHNVAGQIYADPSNWKPILDNAVKIGAIHPDDAQHLASSFQDIPDPTKITEIAGRLMQDTKSQTAQLAKQAEMQFNYDHPTKNPERFSDNHQNMWMTDGRDNITPIIIPNSGGKQMQAPLPPSVQFQNLSLRPEEIEPNAKLIAEGKMPLITGKAALTGAGAATNRRAVELNPNLTGQDFKTVQALENDYTSGKTAKNIQSQNVALEHIAILRKLITNLNNTSSPTWNALANQYKLLTGNPAPTNYAAAQKMVTDEVNKGAVGAAGTGEDRKEVAANVNRSLSPEQLDGALNQYQDLLGGKLVGIEQTYRAGGGRKDFRNTFLTPRVRALLPPSDASQQPQVNGHPQDNEAVNWAKLNPNDPRSSAILKANGVQ